MNIAIDESGSFVYTDAQNSWNCVVAYVYPEARNCFVEDEVTRFLQPHAENGNAEVKLKDLSEDVYAEFLRMLQRFEGVMYFVATNAAMNTPIVIKQHQAEQVKKILEHIDKMVYESAREGLRHLAQRVERLPHQLYVQMICQVQLVLQILLSGILFFVQRHPSTLGRFQWRIDQKNSTVTDYEEAYTQVLPAFLQSASLREPIPMLEGADYSSFDRMYFPKGQEPTYLRDAYGIMLEEEDDRRINVGKIVCEDVLFVDSRSDFGVQVADLLASGLRRCLRNQFKNNERIASLLGSIMVQREHRNVPVQLVSLGESWKVSNIVTASLYSMRASARSMLLR